MFSGYCSSSLNCPPPDEKGDRRAESDAEARNHTGKTIFKIFNVLIKI